MKDLLLLLLYMHMPVDLEVLLMYLILKKNQRFHLSISIIDICFLGISGASRFGSDEEKLQVSVPFRKRFGAGPSQNKISVPAPAPVLSLSWSWAPLSLGPGPSPLPVSVPRPEPICSSLLFLPHIAIDRSI